MIKIIITKPKIIPSCALVVFGRNFISISIVPTSYSRSPCIVLRVHCCSLPSSLLKTARTRKKKSTIARVLCRYLEKSSTRRTAAWLYWCCCVAGAAAAFATGLLCEGLEIGIARALIAVESGCRR